MVNLDFDADRIKTIRQKLGLTSAKFAERLGVAPRLVYYWEDGKRTPDRKDTLAALLQAEAEADA